MRRFAWVVLLCLSVIQLGYADDHIRDFYQEPGLNPFKDDAGDKGFESIDPFSGNLKLSFTDISLPGNGGMDMNVTRVYNNPQFMPVGKETSPIGYGWTMHQGRVVFTVEGNTDSNLRSIDICRQIDGSPDLINDNVIMNNPSFELPDGSRMLFYRDRARNNLQYISKENWRLQCTADGLGYLVTAPNGTRYLANQYSENVGGNINSWYVTYIVDVHGNSINIEYTPLYQTSDITNRYANFAIGRMSAPDGREIIFNYVDAGNFDSFTARLQSIEVAQAATGPFSVPRTWTYTHEPLGIQGSVSPYDLNLLTAVTRPDGSTWSFDYWLAANHNGADSFQFAGLLRQVTYPYANGGSICYQYNFVNQIDGLVQLTGNMSLARKTLGGPCPNFNTDLVAGGISWDYTYDRYIGNELDRTNISLPNGGRIEYDYIGFASIYPNIDGNIWKIGLQAEKRVYDGLVGSGLIEVTQSDWIGRDISDEYIDLNTGVYVGRDPNIFAPQLAEQRIIRINQAYTTTSNTYTTTYNNYDQFGNPRLITETGENRINQLSTRTTTNTYQNNTAQWIIGLNDSSTLQNIGTTTRVYDPLNGNLDSETAYGITTNYTYHPHGGVFETTDARNNTTSLYNYKLGIPQNELRPEGINISRVVSDYGTIDSEINGRGYTTSYSYDALNRVTGITLPRAASLPVTIDWNYFPINSRVVTRGNYKNTKNMDGYGRTIEDIHTDLTTNETITVTYRYDEFDRKTFQSYPNSTSGTIYDYDQLNRIKRIIHSDNTDILYTYFPENRVDIRDENGKTTSYYYRAFGDPSQSSLVQIDSPENITTIIDRNEADQPLRIWQGQTNGPGLERIFVYNPNRLLETETNPETGTTIYGYDEVGNMTSKQVGSSPITIYGYDNLNRMRLIDYPVGTPDATLGYDGNNNVAFVNNSNSRRIYQYDQNDNLTYEDIYINNRTTPYRTNYRYNDLDSLESIQYPSLREIQYAPDVFGRATQAQPYVNSVLYYPSGQLDQIAYNNGVVTDFALDSRLRVSNITTQGLIPIGNLTYTYDNTNNVRTITNAIEPQYSRTFTYDDVNRLATATGIWGNAVFTYSEVGNIDTKTIGTSATTYDYDPITNQLIRKNVNGSVSNEFGYDVYGNISTDLNIKTMQFNDANNMIRAELLNTSAQDPNYLYAYDGNNMRVIRSNNAEQTEYLYSSGGDMLAEFSLTPANNLEHFYLGKKRIATMKGRPSPVANAGADQVVTEGATVTLDGGGSYPPNGYTATYSWVQVSGTPIPTGNIYSTVWTSAEQSPTFVVPSGIYYGDDRSLRFRLFATSSNGERSEDDVVITVQIIDTDADGVSDIWEQTYFPDIAQYDGTSDPDLDGYTNQEEYQLGLDPTVPQPLDEPIGLIVKPGANQNTVYWKSVGRAQGYDIYWSTTPGVTEATGTLVQNVTSPYLHTGLQNGQLYYYIVVARNGCCTSTSAEQLVEQGTRFWAAPSKIMGTPGNSTQIAKIFNTNTKQIQFIYSDSARSSQVYLNGYKNRIWQRTFNEQTGWSNDVLIDTYFTRNQLSNAPLYSTNELTGNSVLAYGVTDTDDGVTLNKIRVQHFTQDTGWSALPDIDSPEAREEIYYAIDNQDVVRLIWREWWWSQGGDAVRSLAYSQTTGWGIVEEIVPGNINATVEQITSSPTGNVLVSWSRFDSGGVFARHFSNSTGWGEAVQVTASLGGSLKSMFLRDGRAVLMWLGTEGNGNPGDYGSAGYQTIQSSTFEPVTGWSPVERLQIKRIVENYQVPEYGNGSIIDLKQSDDGTVYALVITHDFGRIYQPSRLYVKEPNQPLRHATIENPFNQAILYTEGKLLLNGNRIHFIGYPYAEQTSDSPSDIVYTASGAGYKSEIGISGEYDEIYKTDNNNTIRSSNLISTYWSPAGVPSSDAGQDRFETIGTIITLDANASTDDGTVVDYSWRQVSGPTVTLQSTVGQQVQFVADAATWRNDRFINDDPLVFELTVTDDQGMYDKDIVQIHIRGYEPVADAGPDQTIDLSQQSSLFTLDGSGSYDPNGNIVAYRWEQLYLTDSRTVPVTIEGATTISPNVVVPNLTMPAYVIFQLTVTDNDGVISTDTVRYYLTSQEIQQQSANAGPDQVVLEGTTVALIGSTSLLATELLPYSPINWRQISGPTVALIDWLTPSSTFVAPAVTAPTVLEFLFTVRDFYGVQHTDTVRITVQPTGVTDLSIPVVTPPADLAVEATGPSTTVDIGIATASDAEDGVLTPTPSQTGPFAVGIYTITWSVTDSVGNTGFAEQTIRVLDTVAPVLTIPGDIVIDSNVPIAVEVGVATATDLFAPISIVNNAPDIFPMGSYRVRWVAQDRYLNRTIAFQTVTIRVPSVNLPPVANAGPDQTVLEQSSVTLNATASNDPDGTIASFQWTQTSGPIVLLNAANTATPTFTSPDILADTNMSFSVVVTDDQGATASDNVLITVQSVIIDNTAPIVTPPANITQEANAVLTTVAIGAASANDDTDGALTATPDQSGPFGIGITTITWSATDSAGNVGSATQTITIEDATEPVLSVPADISTISDVPVAVSLGSATATDIFTPVVISNNAPALFPVGNTTVVWTATDANGNSATANQSVTVSNPPGVVMNVGATSPATVGTSVNLSANVVGLTGSYEYRFRVRGPATGNSWQTLRGYNTTPSYSWNTSGYQGRNRIQVQARPAGTSNTPIRDAQTFWVNDVNAATAVTVSTVQTNPQYTGTPITINALAEGGSGNYEYQFRVRDVTNSGTWQVLQDYSTSATAQWDTTDAVGKHRIQVRARNAGSQDKHVQTGRAMWLNALDALTGVTISTTPTSPQPIGTVVTLTGTATSGGNGTYEYRFRVRGPATGDVWQVLQDWGSSNTYQWDTTNYSGTHRVQVLGRNASATDRPVRNGTNFTAQ